MPGGGVSHRSTPQRRAHLVHDRTSLDQKDPYATWRAAAAAAGLGRSRPTG